MSRREVVTLREELEGTNNNNNPHKEATLSDSHSSRKGSNSRQEIENVLQRRGDGGWQTEVVNNNNNNGLENVEEMNGLYKPRRSMGLLGIFNCWSKRIQAASGIHHGSNSSSSSPRYPLSKMDNFTTQALLHQNQQQQEALLEYQDITEMLGWQMEHQQALSCMEHALLERTEPNNSLLILTSEVARYASVNSSLRRTPSRASGSSLCNDMSPDVRTSLPVGAMSLSRDACHTSGGGGGVSDGGFLQSVDSVAAVASQFEACLLRCQSEIAFFVGVYMQQMVLSGYSLARTLAQMEPNTFFLRKVHAGFALESRITSALFRCFEYDSFDDAGLTEIFDPRARALARLREFLRMKATEPEEAICANSLAYEPAFHAFCANKSDEILSMFPWSISYNSTSQRDRFTEVFLRAAKWVWLLHRLASTASYHTQIMRAASGTDVDPTYVEIVAPVPPSAACKQCGNASKVEFTIMPGFLCNGKVFRCKVYPHFMCK